MPMMLTQGFHEELTRQLLKEQHVTN
ncbi:MAG: hypothetical protein ACI9S7_000695, partial [Candidatus Paceibacteria bacterium]